MVLIGLGNVLMADEGIGIYLLEALARRAAEFPGVEFADLGTAGMRVLHALAGRRKAVLLDCALMNEPPGTLRRFRPEQVRDIKRMPGFSLHEGDLLQVIELSRRLGEAPSEIVIFGIQPESVAPAQELSPSLNERLPEYIAAVAQELRRNACTSSP